MKWIYRVALEIEIEAKDANEATEVARSLAAVPNYAGHPIIDRAAAWFAPISEQKEET